MVFICMAWHDELLTDRPTDRTINRPTCIPYTVCNCMHKKGQIIFVFGAIGRPSATHSARNHQVDEHRRSVCVLGGGRIEYSSRIPIQKRTIPRVSAIHLGKPLVCYDGHSASAPGHRAYSQTHTVTRTCLFYMALLAYNTDSVSFHVRPAAHNDDDGGRR